VEIARTGPVDDPLGVTSGTIRDRGRSARPFLAQPLLRRRLDIVRES